MAMDICLTDIDAMCVCMYGTQFNKTTLLRTELKVKPTTKNIEQQRGKENTHTKLYFIYRCTCILADMNGYQIILK